MRTLDTSYLRTNPMRRASSIATLIILIVFSVYIQNSRASQESDKKRKPNIIIFVADDAGWRDFGCYGNDAIQTPNIDRLAASGLLATSAFLTTPQCSPSRISVLTGKYPHATGAEDLHMPLPAGEKMLPTYLREAGYYTGHLRKTHYGPNGEKQFDWYSKDLTAFDKFLDATEDQPFFMWVGFKDPHRPYQKGAFEPSHDPTQVKVPPFLVDNPETRADLAQYYDEIARMDSNIGKFLQSIEGRGRLENTVVIFFSDNGAPFPREKGSLYDAGIKTPLIISWPGFIKPGVKYDGLMSVVDLAPTTLEIAGVAVPAHMQGKSFREIFNNQQLPGRDYVFSERNWHNCDEHMRSVRSSRYKLISNAYTELPHGTAADITGSTSWQSLFDLKQAGKLTPAQSLLFEVPRPRIEFYDLENDPWELHNIASVPENKKIVQEHYKVLQEWQNETGDFPPSTRRRADNFDRITGVELLR